MFQISQITNNFNTEELLWLITTYYIVLLIKYTYITSYNSFIDRLVNKNNIINIIEDYYAAIEKIMNLFYYKFKLYNFEYTCKFFVFN